MARSSLHAAVTAFAALAVAMGIGRFAFTPVLPVMLAEGGIDLAGGSALATANYVGYLVGALTAAGLPVSNRAALRTGLLAVSLTTLAMALTHAVVPGAALRFVAGVASAWVLVFASSWGLERVQASGAAPRLAATIYSGVGAGIFVAGALCVALASRGSAVMWLALGALALAASLALWGIGGEAGPRAPSAAPAPTVGERAKLAACYGAFGFGYIVPATYLPAQAQALAPGTGMAALAWPLFGLAAAASVFVAAQVAGRVAPRRTWAAAQALMAVGVILPVLSPGPLALAGCALLVGGTFMVATMAGMQEARRVAGASPRALMATMTAAFAAGQIAGPLLVGGLARTRDAFSLPLGLAAVLLAAGAIALLVPSSRTAP